MSRCPKRRPEGGDSTAAVQAPRSAWTRMPSLRFIWWAIALALTAGFGQGMAMFLHLAAGQPSGLWWVAAAQAHGHIQIFGWGGMFALGVALYFMPRLRGCPAPSPQAIRIAAWLVGSGLLLRAVGGPATTVADGAAWEPLARVALALSGLVELAGVALALGALVAAARRGPPLASRAGLVAVLPFTLAFALSFVAALALNAWGVALAARGTGLVDGRISWLVVQLGLVGMLVSICAAVSARTFPLYLRLRVPPPRELYALAGLFLAGLGLRLAGGLAPEPDGGPATLGSLLLGLAFVGLVLCLDVPLQRSRRELPGQTELFVPEYIASAWLIRGAYAWLGVAGLLLVADALGGWGFGWRPPQDAERHAIGAGLVTLLILGMAVRLLPGFTGRRLASVQLVWATVWLGNAAALLRVVPLFLPSSRVTLALLGLSGLLGLAAVACLALNLRNTLRDPVGPAPARA